MAKKNIVRSDELATAASSSPRRRTTKRASDPPVEAPTYDQIAEAAYHRYLQRGGQHGQDFDDWLEAERSLRSRRDS